MEAGAGEDRKICKHLYGKLFRPCVGFQAAVSPKENMPLKKKAKEMRKELSLPVLPRSVILEPTTVTSPRPNKSSLLCVKEPIKRVKVGNPGMRGKESQRRGGKGGV
jgi:hypothetical protein